MAIDQDLTESESNLCKEYHLRCLEQLGDWNRIGAQDVGSDVWRMKGHVHKLLHGLAASLQFSVREQDLHFDILPDAAVLVIHSGDRDKAVRLIRRVSDKFLSLYGQLSMLNLASQHSLMEKMCVIAEVATFLEQPNNALEMWRRNLPKQNDNLSVWGWILMYRSYFATLLSDDAEHIQECLCSLRVTLADVSLRKGNIHFARSVLKIENIATSVDSIWKLVLCKMEVMDACRQSVANNSKLNRLVEAEESIRQLDGGNLSIPGT